VRTANLPLLAITNMLIDELEEATWVSVPSILIPESEDGFMF
jgi:hypothetical protein